MIILIVLALAFSSVVFAGSASEVINGLDSNASNGGILTGPVNTIVGIIKYIAIAVAFGMIVIIGIKWMTAGAGGKATVKDTLLPYLIGAICVGAFGAIAEFAINLGQDNGGNVTTSTSTSTSTKQNTNTVLCGCSTCNGNQKKYSSSSCGCALCQVGACKCSSCK